MRKRELAQQFHVTERSIQRDMESLRCFFAEQGLRQDIVYDKTARGYRLEGPARFLLDNSEILAVCKILLESRSMRWDEMLPILDKLIACCVPENAKIPMILENEEEALKAAAITCHGVDENEITVVKILDTLHLVDIQVSENLLPYCRSNPIFEVKA